jgi:hypothetical protein
MHCVDHTSSIPMKNHEKSIHTPSFRHLSTSILLSRTVWVFHDPRCWSLPHATVALTSIQQRFVVATFHLNRPRSRNGFILRASVGFHHCTFVNQSLTWLSNNGNYILVIFTYKYVYNCIYIYIQIYTCNSWLGKPSRGFLGYPCFVDKTSFFWILLIEAPAATAASCKVMPVI